MYTKSVHWQALQYWLDFFRKIVYGSNISLLARRGHVAEWLGKGLQNPLHRFNPGRGLQTKYPALRGVFCLGTVTQKSRPIAA